MPQPRRDERWEGAPQHYIQCSVDAKGRLKIPNEIQRWIESLNSKLFVTSWSGLDFQVYLREGFSSQIRFLEEVSLDPELRDSAKRQIFNGRRFGAEAEMDSDGRIHLPPLLRQKLGIDKVSAPFMIGVDNDHFTLMPLATFNEIAAGSEPYMSADDELMKAVGRR
jgi:DNA-binding transcriptional regulator/RsmH inhibitor MraZ